MPDFASQIQDHATSVFLNLAHFAETLTQHPAGVAEDAVSVTAVFREWENESQPKRMLVDGEYVARRASLELADSVSVTDRDVWIRNNEAWQTESIGAVQHGMRTLHLVRHDVNHRSGAREYV